MTIRERIDEFLGLRRLALLGVSRKKGSFSQGLWRELRRRGYHVAPVNPNASSIDGSPCYASVQEIPGPVEGVLVVTSETRYVDAINECARAGIERVWLHGTSGPSASNAEAVRRAEELGIRVVPGFCPYMFLSRAGLLHRFHGWIMKRMGTYP